MKRNKQFIIKKEKNLAPKYVYTIYRYNGKIKEWFGSAWQLKQAKQIIKNHLK